MKQLFGDIKCGTVLLADYCILSSSFKMEKGTIAQNMGFKISVAVRLCSKL